MGKFTPLKIRIGAVTAALSSTLFTKAVPAATVATFENTRPTSALVEGNFIREKPLILACGGNSPQPFADAQQALTAARQRLESLGYLSVGSVKVENVQSISNLQQQLPLLQQQLPQGAQEFIQNYLRAYAKATMPVDMEVFLKNDDTNQSKVARFVLYIKDFNSNNDLRHQRVSVIERTFYGDERDNKNNEEEPYPDEKILFLEELGSRGCGGNEFLTPLLHISRVPVNFPTILSQQKAKSTLSYPSSLPINPGILHELK